ncbi:CDP-diacylglycerol--inositol 3-phosphatidyltransferase [Actinomyces bovis]|uniref:Phosphatidylinositol phosphate synthase n=1 Tax=Actinomyces bovis TaxID=1658 RepID=A0ABY1VQR8_9ACTO|nr:CDP-alcohol phosphatidyltransferase family protein [Actinomyces bovis]SPT54097.1 CDP-diacylglycerol--inositol 3-phosphatidyltransferase [Actinomyces bovis]VEG53681.1 CDP-diacylglycerol--inositol 3-phosphatidyltransferase [Actinomyces israelii]
MLGQHGRGVTKALFTRPALALARLGVTPNMLTVAGTLLTVTIAVLTLPQGHFLLGVALLILSIVGDSFDGILARATGKTSVFGGFLDSTMDRIADGAVFGSLAVWAALQLQPGTLRTTTIALALAVVVLAEVVSYARAKAESLGATAAVGIAERTDRLIVGGLGVAAVGLGAPNWVLTVALGAVALGSLITVGQRVATTKRQLDAREAQTAKQAQS